MKETKKNVQIPVLHIFISISLYCSPTFGIHPISVICIYLTFFKNRFRMSKEVLKIQGEMNK